MKRNYIQPATQVTNAQMMGLLMASGVKEFSLTSNVVPLDWTMVNAGEGATANTAQ